MTLRGRYAPSPSGALHLGNASTALLAWLSVRSRGGSFVVRVEDLDAARTRPEAVSGNLDELRWLGLDWDEGPDVGGPFGPYLQSARGERYAEALTRLDGRGDLFDCYLSRRDLRDLASAPHGSAPIYGEEARAENARRAPAAIAAGKAPSRRFRPGSGEIAFDDLVAGPQRFDLERDVGDVVVRRADGAWAYQLAVVVDDLAMGISEAVRGDDLLASTAIQIALHRALGSEPPRFGHVPLLLGPDGRRMAKRSGSLTLASLRRAGVPPERVVGWLAQLLGLRATANPCTPGALVDGFTLAGLERGPIVVDGSALERLGIEPSGG